MPPLIGLFGGTFDPIHDGHLEVAQGLLELMPLEWIDFIPCGRPAHDKHPVASPADRVAMIRLAIQGASRLRLNTMEVDRPGISYTVDTVKACRSLYDGKTLCLILATDVISHLNEWYHWQEILEYAHIVIADRPQFELTAAVWMQNLLAEHKTEKVSDLLLCDSGRILELHPSLSKITASEIRHYFSLNEESKVRGLLPERVLEYIYAHHLYVERAIPG